jgi:hypothetical protein
MFAVGDSDANGYRLPSAACSSARVYNPLDNYGAGNGANAANTSW